jgi:hypothetical protein
LRNDENWERHEWTSLRSGAAAVATVSGRSRSIKRAQAWLDGLSDLARRVLDRPEMNVENYRRRAALERKRGRGRPRHTRQSKKKLIDASPQQNCRCRAAYQIVALYWNLMAATTPTRLPLAQRST